MKKLLVIGVLFVLVGFFFMKKRTDTTEQVLTVGILQTASHPALDAVRKGFIKEVESVLMGRVRFVINNAEGSIPMAHAMAQSFHVHTEVDAVFAIATPAAQAMVKVEKKKPIFFAAVTDPHKIGLFDNNTNVCGVSDAVDICELVNLMCAMVPNVRRVGLLFNSGEVNSISQVKTMERALKERALDVARFSFTNEAEIAPALTSACQRVDALLVPNDNGISACIHLVSSLALKNKKPLFACDTFLVKRGVLAACGVDYYASGIHVAQQMTALLKKGKVPHLLGVSNSFKGRIIVNKKIADQLSISLSEEVLSKIVLFTKEGDLQ